jgi:UDP-N-acetylmuramoyl-tripeptide--D-alanyl-D-alanine ligase
MTEQAHTELGEYAKAAGVDELWSVGGVSRLSGRAFGEGSRHFDSQAAAIDHCRSQMGPGVTLLVKGSRSAGLDELVRALAIKT